MPKSRLAHDLIRTAESLLTVSRNRPKQADLRRSISTTYYALYHCLCNNCADCVVSRTGDYPKNAWKRAYRAMSHGFAKSVCNSKERKRREILERFPPPIQDFANQFYSMQVKRHQADYDPFFITEKSSVINDIAISRKVIEDFEAVPKSDRQAFTTLVLFKDRHDE